MLPHRSLATIEMGSPFDPSPRCARTSLFPIPIRGPLWVKVRRPHATETRLLFPRRQTCRRVSIFERARRRGIDVELVSPEQANCRETPPGNIGTFCGAV
jgi:hypothetical protein